MKHRELGIEARGLVERGLQLGVRRARARGRCALLGAREASDHAHGVSSTRRLFRDVLAREQRNEPFCFERRELVRHVVCVARRHHQRAPREHSRCRSRSRCAHQLIEHPDRPRPRKPTWRAQQHAREHQALRGRTLGGHDLLRLLDSLTPRISRAREPVHTPHTARAPERHRALFLRAHQRLRERDRGAWIPGHIEAPRVRIEPARGRRSAHLGMRQVGGAHDYPGTTQVLASRKHAVPQRLVECVDGRPELREIANGPEVAHRDGASNPAQDGPPSQLRPRRVGRQPPPQRKPRPGSRGPLDLLGRRHRHIGREAHAVPRRGRDEPRSFVHFLRGAKRTKAVRGIFAGGRTDLGRSWNFCVGEGTVSWRRGR